MEPFETTLTGSDGQVNGLVTPIKFPGSKQAHEFISIDNTLHLSIALDSDGKWIRIAGSTPYFPSWINELAEKILSENVNTQPSPIIPVPVQKKTPAAKTKPTNKVTPIKTEAAITIKTTKSKSNKQTKTAVKSKSTVKKTAVKVQSAKKTKPDIAASKKGKVTSTATKK